MQKLCVDDRVQAAVKAIKENIIFGRDISEEDLYKAIETSQAKEFIFIEFFKFKI